MEALSTGDDWAMMNVVMRPYQGENDYALMRRFLQGLPDTTELGGDCTIGDLDWRRFTSKIPDPMNKLQLWFDGDVLVGFVWPEPGSADVLVDPANRELERTMIEWAVANSQDAESLTIFAHDQDMERQRLLADLGFERRDEFYTYRKRSLDGEIDTPVLPPGYVFCDMRGATAEIVEQRVEVHRAAWAPSKMTVEKHRAVMESETYRPDLDLVIVSPEGIFATCTVVWHDPINEIGVFEPVGCAPDFRQLGLTRALMFEGMRRLQALGAVNAFVASWHASIPANRLYESCGFQLVDHQHKWVKTFRASTP